LGINDKNGINACNLLGIAFTTDHRSLCMATISHIRWTAGWIWGWNRAGLATG